MKDNGFKLCSKYQLNGKYKFEVFYKYVMVKTEEGYNIS